MEFRVQAIDEGIVRLRRSETFAPSMLERYGVLHAEPVTDNSGIEVSGS